MPNQFAGFKVTTSKLSSEIYKTIGDNNNAEITGYGKTKTESMLNLKLNTFKYLVDLNKNPTVLTQKGHIIYANYAVNSHNFLTPLTEFLTKNKKKSRLTHSYDDLEIHIVY